MLLNIHSKDQNTIIQVYDRPVREDTQEFQLGLVRAPVTGWPGYWLVRLPVTGYRLVRALQILAEPEQDYPVSGHPVRGVFSNQVGGRGLSGAILYYDI